MKLLNNLKFKIGICILIFFSQVYFIVINIVEPTCSISYTWHPAIWITINIITFLILADIYLKYILRFSKK